jgi:hypothetical protein
VICVQSTKDIGVVSALEELFQEHAHLEEEEGDAQADLVSIIFNYNLMFERLRKSQTDGRPT